MVPQDGDDQNKEKMQDIVGDECGYQQDWGNLGLPAF